MWHGEMERGTAANNVVEDKVAVYGDQEAQEQEVVDDANGIHQDSYLADNQPPVEEEEEEVVGEEVEEE
eukprot:gene4969-6056_t